MVLLLISRTIMIWHDCFSTLRFNMVKKMCNSCKVTPKCNLNPSLTLYMYIYDVNLLAFNSQIKSWRRTEGPF